MVLVAGVFGALGALLGLPEGPARTVLLALFLLILAIGAFAFLLSIMPFRSAYNILFSCKRLGIDNIHCRGDRGGVRMLRHLRQARRIRIMAVSGLLLIRHIKEEIVTALREKGASVQVLVATPDSGFVQDVEQAESPMRQGQISPEIQQIERLLAEYLAEALGGRSPSTVPCSIEIGHYSTHLRCSLILCDDKWGWVTINMAPKRAIELPSFELRGARGGFLEDCLKHFEQTWVLVSQRGAVCTLEAGN